MTVWDPDTESDAWAPLTPAKCVRAQVWDPPTSTYSTPKGITLRVSTNRERRLCEVRWQGVGVHPSQRPRVFLSETIHREQHVPLDGGWESQGGSTSPAQSCVDRGTLCKWWVTGSPARLVQWWLDRPLVTPQGPQQCHLEHPENSCQPVGCLLRALGPDLAFPEPVLLGHGVSADIYTSAPQGGRLAGRQIWSKVSPVARK